MPPHCDSIDGPVVTAARHALRDHNVDIVLPYVPAAGEDEVREAFARVLPLRTRGLDVAAVADRWFFETVVRVHRVGEHAAFTGLKPAGEDVGPVLPLAEKAIATGDIDGVFRVLTAELRAQLRHRLTRVTDLARDRHTSVAAARQHVEAMLDFELYCNQVYRTLHTDPHGGHEHAAAG
jgi:Family of unknown function (DUF6448)